MSILANLLPAMRQSRKDRGNGKEDRNTDNTTGRGRRHGRRNKHGRR
ncbi:hypothetical protein [Streptomyces sp. CBMA123]|nr:hypothetical protein [Streptomyces sp. CBMA123]